MESNAGVSIVIPTFQEAKNIPFLIERIAKLDFGLRPFEVLLVDDDSRDGIVEVVEQLRTKYSWLKLLVRKAKRDLSLSIIDGFNQAAFPLLVTMDADLSHPPEKMLDMIDAVSSSEVDIVLGSRYVPGGSMDNAWPFMRKAASRLSAFLARLLLPTNVKDPLSGYVAIKKNTLSAGDPFEFIGWKWGLEVLVKCHCKNIKEIPIHFSNRKHGSSKLNFNVTMKYFQHLKKLIIYKLFK